MNELTCKVPNESQLQGFTVNADYSGHGSSVQDILVVAVPSLVIGLMIALMMYIYWYHNTKRRIN